jgi:AraC-like DNA-binding protein
MSNSSHHAPVQARNFLHSLFLVAQYHGITTEQFCSALKIDPQTIADRERTTSRELVIAAYQLVLKHTDDEFLGVGTSAMPRGTVRLMVKLAQHDKTLNQALKSIDSILRISQAPIKLEVKRHQDLVTWQFIPKVKEPAFYSIITIIHMGLFYHLLSLLTQKEVILENISFSVPRPPNFSDFQFLFQRDLKFNQPQFSISIKRQWLKLPINCNYQELKKHLDVPLSLINYALDTYGIIRQVKDIFVLSQHQLPSLTTVAAMLNMSVRTLQRKLDREKVSFQALKDDIRQKKALFYIEHTDKSMEHVAQRCGFKEVSSFTRAFIRWTGCSPSKYQQLNGK